MVGEREREREKGGERGQRGRGLEEGGKAPLYTAPISTSAADSPSPSLKGEGGTRSRRRRGGRSLELQAALARRVGERLHAAVVRKAAAVERDLGDAGGGRELRELLADRLRRGLFVRRVDWVGGFGLGCLRGG